MSRVQPVFPMTRGQFKPSDLDADLIHTPQNLSYQIDPDEASTRFAPHDSDSDALGGNRRTVRAWLKPFAFFMLGVLSFCTLTLVLLTLPSTKQILVELSDTPALVYLRGIASPDPRAQEPIRVADQLDSLRLEKVDLNKDDLQVAIFFAKKYRLATTQVQRYIAYAHKAAKEKNLDPMLLLAVMSIESNLNPITESPVGAQGLMQVMTHVHTDKLTAYGGDHAVFNPEINVMVGATILADCIKLGGSVEMGLKCYSGASGPSDYGYGAKVLAEKERIEKAKLGVFDFTSNNKVLVDMGILAPNPPTSLADSNQNNAVLQIVQEPGHGSQTISSTSNPVNATAAPHPPASVPQNVPHPMSKPTTQVATPQ